MATITITRSVMDQGALVDVDLVSAFQRNSMDFTVDRGAVSGTYATVKIVRSGYGTFEFRSVKTGTVGTTDSYTIDLTSVFANMVGSAPINTTSLLSLIASISIIIVVYEADNSYLDESTPEYVRICFAYNNIGVSTGLNDISIKGSSRTIYHNGKIGFYNMGSPGAGTLIIAGVSKSYTLANHFNVLSLDATHYLNGTITRTGTTLSIPVYYKPAYGDQEIAWLNRDGGWSFWNFRKVSEEIVVKKSNEVATYYSTNALTISKSRMISAEKTVRHAFDTLAYDPTHFAHLCEIQESLAVIWNNKLVKVASSNSLTAVCKQNLRFNLILEVDENIAGY